MAKVAEGMREQDAAHALVAYHTFVNSSAVGYLHGTARTSALRVLAVESNKYRRGTVATERVLACSPRDGMPVTRPRLSVMRYMPGGHK